MLTNALNSLPGRVLRFAAGAAIALSGFAFDVVPALFIQTLGVTMAVFALADISVLRALHIGERRRHVVREKHA